MTASPLDNVSLVTFTIKAAGSEINSAYQVARIEVGKAVNKVPYARVAIFDGSTSEQDFPISNLDDFLPGVSIEILAGYNSTEVTIFKGTIVSHGIQISHEASKLELVCRDDSIKMTVGRKNAYFQEELDSDIISGLIGAAGATADVEATTITHPNLSQYYVSDFDFMVMRAEVNGLVVIPDDGTVSVKPPDTSSAAVLELEYGTSILDFNASVNAVDQLSSVKGYAWDMATQAIVNGEGSATATTTGNVSNDDLTSVIGLSEFILQSPGAVTADELTAWASGKLLKSKLSKVDGSVTFQGSSLVKPGTNIQLTGVGSRFNGTTYVTAVHHTIEDGEWTTEASFGMNFEWFEEETPNVNAPPASGLLASVSGLQTGMVMKINEDPDGEFRVQVKLPMMQDDSMGVWARFGQFYGTSGAGSFFYPEIDDEVIVGFLNDDPRYPVILGSLYSSGRAPAYTPDENNYTKAIVSNEQLKIIFDDENKGIQLITPGGNQMSLNDTDEGIIIEDQNGNKMEFSSSGITIESASDMTLKATGDVSIEGGGNVAIKATSNLTMKGLEVEASADTTATVKGSASAELSASGNVTVKGAMVMIN